MKKAIIWILVIVLLAAVVFGVVQYLQNRPITVREDGLGFEIELPASWKGKYEMTRDESGIWFASSANKEFGGMLFGVVRDAENVEYPSYDVVSEADGVRYLFIYPSDVPYDVENAAHSKEYVDLASGIGAIKQSFRVLQK